MRSVDTDADSLIDYEEFANRFQVVFLSVKAKQRKGEAGAMQRRPSDPNITLDWATLEKSTQAALQRLGQMMMTSTTVQEAFSHFDPDGTKHVSVEDFARALRNVDDQLRCAAARRPTLSLPQCDPHLPRHSDADAMRLARVVDANHSGSISLDEFAKAFHATDAKPAEESITSWQHAVWPVPCMLPVRWGWTHRDDLPVPLSPPRWCNKWPTSSTSTASSCGLPSACLTPTTTARSRRTSSPPA